MLFSVVIPLYNKADTIERTIRSVWAQSFNDYELIVVNDGSTDGSLNVVKELSSEAPIVIVDKKNGGVSSARNAGANLATGKYIALLDGDDVWYPNHLGMLANAIARCPGVKFFGSGYEWVSEKYGYYTIPWGGYRVKNIYSAFRYGQPINSSTVAIERDLWIRIGGFVPRYSFYEDYEFFFRLGLHTKCCVIRKISGRYMRDAIESATKTHRAITSETRPHIKFLEEQIKSRTANHSMVCYAKTLVRLDWALNTLVGIPESAQGLKAAFPQLIAMFSPKIKCLRRIYAFLIVWCYKFRNHLIIWKKSQKAPSPASDERCLTSRM